MGTKEELIVGRIYGWSIKTSSNPDGEIELDKVTEFYNRAMNKVADYLDLEDSKNIPSDNSIIMDAVYDWAAGLCYQWKYTLQTNEVDIVKFGDTLISDAKRTLDNYMNRKNRGGEQREKLVVGYRLDKQYRNRRIL